MDINQLRNPHLEGDALIFPGNSTGVLLIHGFTATTAEVRLLAERLHAHGYTVAGPLLPGHGTTPHAMSRCRWQDWAKAATDAYADIKGRCERVVVGGESMGALLALYLASEHPEIAGVIGFAPALVIPRRRLLLARLMAPFTAYRPKPAGRASDADARWKGYAVNPLRSVIELGRLQQEVLYRLPRIRQPILIVQGRLDQAIDPRSGEIVLRKVNSPIKELHWLERSTHCVILDCEWEQAAELAQRFIDKVIDPIHSR